MTATILPTLWDIATFTLIFLIACLAVFFAMCQIGDEKWEEDNISRSIDELERLYAMPFVLSGGRERGRVERWRRS